MTCYCDGLREQGNWASCFYPALLAFFQLDSKNFIVKSVCDNQQLEEMLAFFFWFGLNVCLLLSTC